MLTICTDVDEARRTVLNRAAAGSAYPAELLQRIAELFGAALTPAAAVARVLQDVSRDGDGAAAAWSKRLDGVAADPLAVPAAELAAAASRLPAALNTALQLAAQRIRTFHENQQPRSWSSAALGGQLGQRVVALRRVGIYVPGGSAPLASSLLMAALPAAARFSTVRRASATSVQMVSMLGAALLRCARPVRAAVRQSAPAPLQRCT